MVAASEPKTFRAGEMRRAGIGVECSESDCKLIEIQGVWQCQQLQVGEVMSRLLRWWVVTAVAPTVVRPERKSITRVAPLPVRSDRANNCFDLFFLHLRVTWLPLFLIVATTGCRYEARVKHFPGVTGSSRESVWFSMSRPRGHYLVLLFPRTPLSPLSMGSMCKTTFRCLNTAL